MPFIILSIALIAFGKAFSLASLKAGMEEFLVDFLLKFVRFDVRNLGFGEVGFPLKVK